MGQRSSREASVHNAEAHAQRSSSSTPQIRCYTCSGIFMATQRVDHIRCPFCSTINGVPSAGASAAAAAPLPRGNSAVRGEMSTAAAHRQEQLLRRLQAREVTPLELLILREFVEHLQQNRSGASTREIDLHTASWVVDDVSKLPEELRSCCVCLEDVCVGNSVRTLPCLHTFHADCAEQWLQKKKVCPLCQFPIDGTGEEGETSTAAETSAAAAAP